MRNQDESAITYVILGTHLCHATVGFAVCRRLIGDWLQTDGH